MLEVQKFGIKYPFTSVDKENYFVDLNSDLKDKVRSLLMHLIFTPRGQRIRRPDFGTRLIEYIFDPSDDSTWNMVMDEIKETVSRYVSNITINDINIIRNDEDEHEIYVRLDYSIQKGNKIESDSIVTKV